jgi:hypothetical protein
VCAANPPRAGACDKLLATIRTEDVQQLKSALTAKSPKTVKNISTVLNVQMRTAVEGRASIKSGVRSSCLRAPSVEAGFYDFEQFEGALIPRFIEENRGLASCSSRGDTNSPPPRFALPPSPLRGFGGQDGGQLSRAAASESASRGVRGAKSLEKNVRRE